MVMGTESIDVIILAAPSVPRVALSLSSSAPSSYSDTFAIIGSVETASVTSMSNLNYTYSFGCLSSDGSALNTSAYAAPIDLTNSANLAMPLGSPSLKFKPGVLQAGGTYCIHLQITDLATNMSGAAQTTFKVRAGPQSGYCKMSTASCGLPFNDRFGITCAYWVTDSAPLYYTWEAQFINNHNASWVQLAPQDVIPSLATVLPMGTVRVRVIITDGTGARIMYPTIFNFVISSNPQCSSLSRKRAVLDRSPLETRAVTGADAVLSYLQTTVITAFNSTRDAK